MHIFGRRKEVHTPELVLTEGKKNGRFDFWAALAKALLIFMLIFGSMGGMLSALEVDYDREVSACLILVLALVLSLAYESGKRWLINVVQLVVLFGYFVMAMRNFWLINSGYYSILNRFYTVARGYLRVADGLEFLEMVEESYRAVTAFVIFIGMVAAILLSIMMQRRCGLFRLLVISLLPILLMLYFECSPSLGYIWLLFTAYAALAMLQGAPLRTGLSERMRSALPLAAAAVSAIVCLTVLIVPASGYEDSAGTSAWKKSTEEQMKSFAQVGLMAFIDWGTSSAGIGGGHLSRSYAVRPSYETALVVRYTPYDYEPVYLKAFTGKDYTGEQWTKAADGAPDNGKMTDVTAARKSAYEKDASAQGRGIMEVELLAASGEYGYRPYYTDDSATTRKDGVISYIYYPDAGQGGLDTEEAGADYLTVPASCERAVAQVCEQEGFSGTPEEIADQISEFFEENYAYTLRPGIYFPNADYISHFLLTGRKGYCAHFASAGTMLLRYMGIPARYVEGYAFTYFNVTSDGKLLEDAAYGDYYDGYAPLGETGCVELRIPEAYAHAWVEIYVEGRGWIVTDPTPPITDEETDSFWSAFMRGEDSAAALDFSDSPLGGHLRNAAKAAGFAIVLVVLLALGVLAATRLVRVRWERSLTGRERVKLEYRRIVREMERHCRDYGKLRTIRQQMERLRQEYALDIPREQEQALYRIFFAEESPEDCDRLCSELKLLRQRIKRAFWRSLWR